MFCMKTVNMNKKTAPNTKSLTDCAKSLKLRNTSNDSAPIIVIETEKRNFIIHEKNSYILTVAREVEAKDDDEKKSEIK